MAEKKLFQLETSTPKSGDMFAFGNMDSLGITTGTSNITFATLKTLLQPNLPVKSIALEIGAWNMNSSSNLMNVKIYSAMTTTDFFGTPMTYYDRIPVENIRGVKILIRNNANTVITDFLSVQNGTAVAGAQISLMEVPQFIGPTQTLMSLTRRVGSIYATSTDYNSVSVNRGWVVVDYVE